MRLHDYISSQVIFLAASRHEAQTKDVKKPRALSDALLRMFGHLSEHCTSSETLPWRPKHLSEHCPDFHGWINVEDTDDEYRAITIEYKEGDGRRARKMEEAFDRLQEEEKAKRKAVKGAEKDWEEMKKENGETKAEELEDDGKKERAIERLANVPLIFNMPCAAQFVFLQGTRKRGKIGINFEGNFSLGSTSTSLPSAKTVEVRTNLIQSLSRTPSHFPGGSGKRKLMVMYRMNPQLQLRIRTRGGGMLKKSAGEQRPGLRRMNEKKKRQGGCKNRNKKRRSGKGQARKKKRRLSAKRMPTRETSQLRR